MIVKEQKPIEFINACGCLVNYDLLEQAIIWYQKSPTARLKRIYLHSKYPTVSIHDKKIHIHRLLKMYTLRHSIDKNECVHHLDGNRLNCLIDNLVNMNASKHSSLHNKGKPCGEKQRKHIILFNHSRKGTRQPKRRTDVTVDKVLALRNKGLSICDISSILAASKKTICARLHDIHDKEEL